MRKPVAKASAQGMDAFIKMLRKRLDALDMNQKQLCEALTANGYDNTKQDVISKLVGARVARINGILVWAIGRTIGFPHPARSNDFYTTDELIAICCGLIDAQTGLELTPDQVRDRIAPNPFVAWLSGYLRGRGVGDAEFLLHVQQETNIKGLDLNAIMKGDRLPTNAELQELTAILDHEDGSMYTFAELEQIRDRKPGLPPASSKKAPTSKRQGQSSGAKARHRAIIR